MNREWVQTELRNACQAELREQRPGQKLFPIRLVSIDRIRDWSCFDADTGKCRRLSPRAAFPLSARADYTQRLSEK